MRTGRTPSLLGALTLALVLGACSSSSSAPQPTAPSTRAVPTVPSSALAPAPSPSASPSPALIAASPSALAVASPSPSAAAAAANTGPKPVIKMGSANFSESVLLAELYAQMLENNGYQVERHLNLGTREVDETALESNQINMEPEYMASELAFVTQNGVTASSDPATTMQSLQDALGPKGITVLKYAAAIDTNGLAVTQATAQKDNLSKTSDLAPVASQMVLGGPPECPQRPYCLLGYQQTYGLQFKDFQSLDSGGPLTLQALLGNQIDVAVLFTTDPNIATQHLVLLDDDKHLQLSDNVAPLIRNDALNQSPDVANLANQVSAKLTTDILTSLNQEVSVNHEDENTVAANWLKSQNLTH